MLPLVRVLRGACVPIPAAVSWWAVTSFTIPHRRCSSTLLFSDLYNFSPLVLQSLKKQGLTHPTDIQQKSLRALYDERLKYMIVNSETGSGKTLCYLLPILEFLSRCWEKKQPIPVPSALVLIPTTLLAHQVDSVFKSLALPQWDTSLCIRGRRLIIKNNTHLIVATPSTLMNFDLTKLLCKARYVCVDEADMLLTSGEKASTFAILDRIKKLNYERVKQAKRDRESEVEESLDPLQTIFTAATFPSGGPMTITPRLKRELPLKATKFITTEFTHHVIPSVDTRFVDIEVPQASQEEDEESAEDVGMVNNEVLDQRQNDKHPSNKFVKLKQKRLLSDLEQIREEFHETEADEHSLPKILVFVNTADSAQKLYKYLERKGQEVKSVWWSGKVDAIYKGMNTLNDVENVMERFRYGKCCILVSTDLASRGLDILGVTAVIQFDFPVNSADFLHRAGRTARAGKPGKVISYVGSGDRDLAEVIREVIEDKGKSFDSIFSRNKMLRRKIKRRKKAEHKQKQEIPIANSM